MWLADADADAADAAAAALTHKKGLTEIFYLPFFPLFTFTHSIKAEFEVEVAAAVSLFSFSCLKSSIECQDKDKTALQNARMPMREDMLFRVAYNTC